MQIREKEFTAIPVRAIIAVLIVAGLVAGFFMKLIDPADFKEIAMIVLVFYFAKRNETDQLKNGTNSQSDSTDGGDNSDGDSLPVPGNLPIKVTATAQAAEPTINQPKSQTSFE